MTYRQAKLTEAISLIRLGMKILNQIDTEGDWTELLEDLDCMVRNLEAYERLFG